MAASAPGCSARRATLRSAPSRCCTSPSPTVCPPLFDWPLWLGFLVVGIALFVVAGICGGIGFTLVKKVKAPERTIAQANQTVTEVKAAAQHALAAAKAPQIEGQVVNQKSIR